MKRFATFLRKEFAHVLRDRKTLLILFGMPVVQILIFGFALTNEVSNARIAIVDQSNDNATRRIIERLSASRYFDITETITDPHQMTSVFRSGNAKLVIVFPVQFEQRLAHDNTAEVQVLADASDPNVATTLTNYVNAVLLDYQQELSSPNAPAFSIKTEMRMLYNPQLKGVHNFVPGVMALVLMLVCVMMTAVSIVREKEMGTMEVLLVSPFQPLLVMISKAVPYLILSIINVISILLLSVYVLHLPVNGSLALLMAESILFIITCLTIGIFISVKTSSQQVAMLISLMGMMLPTILFSGFMFPIENMPIPLQIISNIVPAKWYYIIVKSVMIKGLGFSDIWKETLILAGLTLFMMALSLKNFKIRLA
ncbi:ABC transporter permease [Chryseolinea sp. T2]|uniref:ABC transporter permease n=1 Tax=Chryseolinea sp. T2 TaxID=3129255 RepID=UPI00307838F4